MPGRVQMTFDCADPAALSSFYAAALHYRREDPPNGFTTWDEYLASIGVPEAEWNTGASIVDPEGREPRIFFQQESTPKPGKNRLHLDIRASGGRDEPVLERKKKITAESERLRELGAIVHCVEDEPGWFYIVMQDPEGNEFCLN